MSGRSPFDLPTMFTPEEIKVSASHRLLAMSAGCAQLIDGSPKAKNLLDFAIDFVRMEAAHAALQKQYTVSLSIRG